jgi:hypothetical protein
METGSTTIIGEITDFEIYIFDTNMLTASIELKILDDFREFGGKKLFSSVPNHGPDLVGHFIMRCFQTLGVDKTRDLEGELVKVKMEGDEITGISSLRNDDYFYPATEFEQLLKSGS